MLKIGSIFADRYLILHELGRGGMSTVYLAMDKKVNRQYAIKVIRKDLHNAAAIAVDTLKSESHLLSQLDHPSIPKIYDIVENHEHICVIMDYIHGDTLNRVIDESGPQRVETVVAWARQLAEVLSYLHTQGIIYRDMKPANVILQPDGQLKLVDFGIARNVISGPADTTVLGTRGYAAPEIYASQYDERSDIYALGMTLHYLLTGITPDQGGYFPVKHWRPEVPDALDAIIEKCVRPDPDKRYQNCVELMYDLTAPASRVQKKSLFDAVSRFVRGLGKRQPQKPVHSETADTMAKPPVGDFDEISPPLPTEILEGHAEELSQVINDLVQYGASSDMELILRYTEYQDLVETNRVVWSRLRHLNIIGDRDPVVTRNLRKVGLRSGSYLNAEGTWLLLTEPNPEDIQHYISRCGDGLEVLQIGKTGLRMLSVAEFTGLRELILPRNRSLCELHGLENLHKLTQLNLSATALEGTLDLSSLVSLQRVILSETKITGILLNQPLPELEHFFAIHGSIRNLAYFYRMPNLRTLALAGCPLHKLPHMSSLPKLEFLDISNSSVFAIPGLDTLTNLQELDCSHTGCVFPEDMTFPNGLVRLDLSATPMRRIPESIRGLQDLRTLNLSGLQLEDLPDWLPEIVYDFDVGQAATIFINDVGCAVNLVDTTVTGVNMEIFSRPYAMVKRWFQERAAARTSQQDAPLNEIKVVFLGDGEAGKSLTVARLLLNGDHPENFDGNATPGIAIAHRTYDLDDRKVQVHFWDFGGQEILHSMHRMFLTKRTLYVVLLNARDDTQDERARYWLHNVRSFADGAPVLLVLNKIDQNPNAGVNESGLREMYPSLTEVVKMSALKFSAEEFNKSFTAALKRQISNFEELESPFLASWHALKTRLSNMEAHYIHSPEFNQLCEECGIEQDEKARKALLKWFSDLGVSFCYSDSTRLEDYVILRPDWITNAIYILLFNPIPGQKNGMVPHEAIYQMLKPNASRHQEIRSVLPGVRYSVVDAEYVLNVIRRFRLSYLVDEQTEFFPMLCQKDAMPIAARYAADPGTLEFCMVYDYLPNNVIHRLMVDMHRDLDTENVWLTGARFSQEATGLSAVVKSDGNTLRIYVRSTKLRHPADFYLDIIKDVLARINKSMGLKVAQNQVVYKANGISESFDYDMLVGMLENGVKDCYSMVRKRMVSIEEILMQTDHRLDADRDNLLKDIIKICQMLQADKLYWDVSENDRNTFVRNTLRAMDYIAMDQSLSGISAGGKLPGELDIDVRKNINIPWTIFEGLNLKGTGTAQLQYWDNHLKKLLDNYNSWGLPFLVLTSYVPCKKSRFLETFNSYSSHIKYYSPGEYRVQSMTSVGGQDEENHFLRVIQCIYDCGGCQTTVYQIFVRLGDNV